MFQNTITPSSILHEPPLWAANNVVGGGDMLATGQNSNIKRDEGDSKSKAGIGDN